MKKILSVLSLTALLLVSCSKKSDTTGTNNNNNNSNAPLGQVLATVGGTNLTLTGLATKTGVSGAVSLGLVGTDATGRSVVIAMINITASGTYDIGTVVAIVPPQSIGIDYTTTDASGTSISYSSTNQPAVKQGTITITSYTATNIQGTFSATGLKTDNATASPQTVDIASGSFNLNF